MMEKTFTSPRAYPCPKRGFEQSGIDRARLLQTQCLISHERTSNTSIPGDQGRATETHSGTVLETWAHTSHVGFKIAMQDIVWMLIEMDLLFLKKIFKPRTCSNEPQIKILSGCFLSSFKLFFSFWHVSD